MHPGPAHWERELRRAGTLPPRCRLATRGTAEARLRLDRLRLQAFDWASPPPTIPMNFTATQTPLGRGWSPGYPFLPSWRAHSGRRRLPAATPGSSCRRAASGSPNPGCRPAQGWPAVVGPAHRVGIRGQQRVAQQLVNVVSSSRSRSGRGLGHLLVQDPGRVDTGNGGHRRVLFEAVVEDHSKARAVTATTSVATRSPSHPNTEMMDSASAPA
jgi:hypothetical protein